MGPRLDAVARGVRPGRRHRDRRRGARRAPRVRRRHARRARPVALDDPAAIIYTSGHDGPRQGRGPHPRQPHLGRDQLRHRLRRHVRGRRAHDLADVPRRVARDGGAAHRPQGRHARGRARIRARAGAGPDRAPPRHDAERGADHLPADVPTTPTGTPRTSPRCASSPAAARPAPTRVIEAYEERGLRFSQGYGMTEASPGRHRAVAREDAREGGQRRAAPLLHRRAHRATRAAGVAARARSARSRSPAPTSSGGYHELPRRERGGVPTDGWFRSGDLGYLDEDGYLFIAGRTKDMIISGGENIYPAEVEAAITEMAGVTGVAVIGMPDDKWGEVPWAVLTVARRREHRHRRRARRTSTARLARYKLPQRVVIVDELPRTASGQGPQDGAAGALAAAGRSRGVSRPGLELARRTGDASSRRRARKIAVDSSAGQSRRPGSRAAGPGRRAAGRASRRRARCGW